MREFDLLKHVYASNSAFAADDSTVLIPPGDDLAMVKLASGRLLAGVDQLVAGRHVRLESTPLKLVGRKAVVRSLSDIAAMAAKPLSTLAAVTLPPDFGEERALQLFDAMRETADAYGCPLIGGDIALHTDPAHPMVCSVTVLAEPAQSVITRGGAQPGDFVYVTGSLGGAWKPDGTGKHLTFEPRIREALDLAAVLGHRLHAMIDISDGLGRDAAHIAEQSGVAIELDAARIPCEPGLDWNRALRDGEDYELCFTAAPDAAIPLHIGQPPGVRITRVGRVVPLGPGEEPRCVLIDGPRLIDVSSLGWQHES